MKRIAILTALFLGTSVLLTGCPSWERTAYQTLATSQQTLNDAQAAYEVSKDAPCPVPANPVKPCIAHTKAAAKAITDGKVAWKAAADAMITYESVKAANGTPDALAKAQAGIQAALANIGTIIADVKALEALGGK